MKKVLITGKDSYIGTAFEKWVSQWPEDYQVKTVDVRDNTWENHDLSVYDVVLHVAAIVHVKEKNKKLYYSINRDLAYKIAKKSKEFGVNQFIFISTMGIYGKNSGVIDKNTLINPKNSYAKSKFEAEKLIFSLKTKKFKITVMRPPLVYGEFCKGNYLSLSKFAKNSPVFPNVNNRRSMIFIDNLSNYIKIIIDLQSEGVHFPQNVEYVNITSLVKLISNLHHKKLRTTKLLNFVKMFKFIGKLDKVFSDFYYSKDIYSDEQLEILKKSNVCSFEDSIIISEGKNIDNKIINQ